MWRDLDHTVSSWRCLVIYLISHATQLATSLRVSVCRVHDNCSAHPRPPGTATGTEAAALDGLRYAVTEGHKMGNLLENRTRCLIVHPGFSDNGFFNYSDVARFVGAKYSATPLGALTVAALFPQ